jgi:hypothetical protein
MQENAIPSLSYVRLTDQLQQAKKGKKERKIIDSDHPIIKVIKRSRKVQFSSIQSTSPPLNQSIIY